MTPQRRKAKIEMLRQKITFSDLAGETGLSLATIHATLSNTCVTVNSRRAISNALQVQLWSDVPLTQRFVTFPAGTEIEYMTAKEARESAADELAAGIVERKGRVIVFIKPATFVTEIRKPNPGAELRKFRRGSVE